MKAVPQIPRWLRRVVWAVGIAVILGATFYALVNWHADRAWQKYQRTLMAQGQRFDPGAFNLPPVPDSENFLKAPKVKDWLAFGSPSVAPPVVKGIAITRPGDVNLMGSWTQCRPTDLKEWRDSFLAARRPPRAEVTDPGPSLPLIVFDDIPLLDVIRNLARQAALNFRFEPNVANMNIGGKPIARCSISIRFENVSAYETLLATLDNNGLALLHTETSNVLCIAKAVSPSTVWPNEGVDLATASLPAGVDDQIPLVVYDEVTPPDAVRMACRMAGLSFQFAPEAFMRFTGTYSLRLTNTTGRELLTQVLADNGLRLKTTRDSLICHVVPQGSVCSPHATNAAAVLQSFGQFNEEFKSLYAACRRPRSGWDVDYRQFSPTEPVMPNFGIYRQVAQALVLHASAHLALSNSAVALEDATGLFRIAEALHDQPMLVSAMLRVGLCGPYLQVVWEGLAGHRWNQNELAVLEEQLQSIDLLAGCATALEGEQALLARYFESLPQRTLARQYAEEWAMAYPPSAWRTLGTTAMEGVMWSLPRGWKRHVQISYAKGIQASLLPLDARGHRAYPERQLRSYYGPSGVANRFTVWAYFILPTGPYFTRAVEVTVREQTHLNLARIACALERYRLASGQFPKSLAQLTPQFMAAVPSDLVTGAPLKYERTADGQFVLYSIGWNLQDDRAQPDADWVWRYPAR